MSVTYYDGPTTASSVSVTPQYANNNHQNTGLQTGEMEKKQVIMFHILHLQRLGQLETEVRILTAVRYRKAIINLL